MGHYRLFLKRKGASKNILNVYYIWSMEFYSKALNKLVISQSIKNH